MNSDKQKAAELLRQKIALIEGGAPISEGSPKDRHDESVASRLLLSPAKRGRSGRTNEASDSDDGRAAFDQIVRWLSHRDYSALDMRVRLERKGFSSECTEVAVARAVELGLINDKRYAELLVRSRIGQGKGLAGIKRELQDSGIDFDEMQETVPECRELLEEAPCEDDRAFQLLERKPPRSKNKREGAYRKLVQKGFSSSVAAQVARKWAEDHR